MGDQAVAHGVPPGPGDALNEEPNQGLGTAIPMVDGTNAMGTRSLDRDARKGEPLSGRGSYKLTQVSGNRK